MSFDSYDVLPDELLAQRHPQPVPVSERWPEFSDCDNAERVWCWSWAIGTWSPELVQVGSRGIGHVWAESADEFIAGCHACNLEWLVPPSNSCSESDFDL